MKRISYFGEKFSEKKYHETSIFVWANIPETADSNHLLPVVRVLSALAFGWYLG